MSQKLWTTNATLTASWDLKRYHFSNVIQRLSSNRTMSDHIRKQTCVISKLNVISKSFPGHRIRLAWTSSNNQLYVYILYISLRECNNEYRIIEKNSKCSLKRTKCSYSFVYIHFQQGFCWYSSIQEVWFFIHSKNILLTVKWFRSLLKEFSIQILSFYCQSISFGLEIKSFVTQRKYNFEDKRKNLYDIT